MRVNNLFLNLIQRIKNAVAHSDANLQTAKDYTNEEVSTLTEFEDLTSRMTSGTQYYSIRNSEMTFCYRIGGLLFLNAYGNATANLTTAMTLPYVRIPASNPQILNAGCSVNGMAYTLVNIGDWSGVKYLKQNISSSISNGSNIVFWAILKVGGVIPKIYNTLARGCYA